MSGFKRSDMSELTPVIESYRDKITTSWKEATASILRTASLLLEAETELSELEFLDLLGGLPFSQSTASKLLTIGQNKHLSNYQEHLPPHWTTIYELALMPEEQLKTEIEAGHINPSVDGVTVRTIRQTPVKQTPPSNPETIPLGQTESQSANAVFGRIEIPEKFDRLKVNDFQRDLSDLLDRYGAEFIPDTTKAGLFRVRREALAIETEDWLRKRERSYNKANLSDNDIKVLEDAIGQKKGKIIYHANDDGTFDRNDIRHPEHPYHGWDNTKFYAYCRENMIISSWTRIRELDKTAWVKQLVLTHSTGNAHQRLEARRKLERLVSRGGEESSSAASEALEMLIDPL